MITSNPPTLPRVLTLAPLTVDGHTFDWYLLPDGTRVARGTVAGAYVALDWRWEDRIQGLIRRGRTEIHTGPLVGGIDAAARHLIRIAQRVDETGAPNLYGSDPR